MSATTRSAFLPLLLVACASLMPGCGGDGLIDDGRTDVDVTLREYVVTPDRTTAPNGPVRFRVTNAGIVEHEFLVVKTDLAPGALPTNPNGSYMEDGPGTVIVDEIDGIAAGASADLTVELSEGNYVLLCNEVMGGVSHYNRGMRTSFTVN